MLLTTKKQRLIYIQSTLIVVFSCKKTAELISAMGSLHQECAFNSESFPTSEHIPEGTNRMGGIWKPYLEQVNIGYLKGRKKN